MTSDSQGFKEPPRLNETSSTRSAGLVVGSAALMFVLIVSMGYSRWTAPLETDLDRCAGNQKTFTGALEMYPGRNVPGGKSDLDELLTASCKSGLDPTPVFQAMVAAGFLMSIPKCMSTSAQGSNYRLRGDGVTVEVYCSHHGKLR